MVTVATALAFPLAAAPIGEPPLEPPALAVIGLVLTLLTAGMLKCGQIMRRSTTNGTCVAALLALQAALFTLFAGGLFARLFQLGMGANVLVVFATFVLLVVAIVLGIVGLLDLRKRRFEFVQGRAQAWWGIGLSTCLLVMMGVGFWSGFKAGFERASAQVDAEGRDGDLPVAGVGGAIDPGAVEQFDSLNFTFRQPTAEWVQLDAKSLNPDASLMYVAANPQTYFTVIAEKVGVEVPLDNNALVEIVKAHLQAAGEPPTFDQVRPAVIAGIKGMFVDASARINGQLVPYRYWVANHRGYCYQLIAHGPGPTRTTLDQRAEQLISGFALIDAERTAHAEGFESVRALESPLFGCRLDLSGGDWTLSRQAAKDFPGGEFLATLDNSACVSVVALCLPSVDPPLEELVDAAFTATVADFDASRRTELRPIAASSVAGAACEFESNASGEATRFQVRVFKHEGRAYVFVAWADPSASPQTQAGLDAALRSISFSRVFTSDNAVGPSDRQLIRGLVLNELGLAALLRRDYAASEKCLADAMRLRPDDDVVLGNYLVALRDGGGVDRALAALDERLPRFPRSMELRAWRAQLLKEIGDHAAGREVYEQLFRDGYADEDALMALITMQLDADEVDAALASVEEFLKRRASWDVERWKGQLLSEKGDHEAAIALFRTRRERRPADPQTALDLAEAHESAEEYAEALAIATEYADAKLDADLWHLLRGRCQLGLKWYREARQSFQAALDANPQSEDARELEAYAAGLLGQGNLAGATVAIAPVPIPETLQAKIDGLPPLSEKSAEFGLAEKHRLTGYSYVPDKEWKCTVYRTFKIFGPEGVDQLSSLSVSFDPLGERVYVNRLAVRDAQGQVVAEGDVDDYYVTDDDASGLATTDQTLNVPVPQLKPGCTLEFVYTRERLGAPEEFGFESVLLASSNPVQFAAAFVVGETDKVAAESARVDVHDEGDDLRYWIVDNPQPYVWEPDQTCLNDFLPFVYLSDNGATWENLGREHYDYIKERLAVDEQVAQRARELIGNATTAEEKVDRLAQFVQHELTYQGLEFGIRGQMPHPANRTLKAGYGDCKDHAVLLKQMLNAVDVPAEIALVLTTGRVVPSLPSIDQFDHMVVYLPDAPLARAFVDCTSKHADPASALFPDCEGGQALVLDPERPRLTPTPADPAGGSLLRCDREVEVVYEPERPDAADAIVTETVTCDPLLAPALRGALASLQPQERKGVVADLLRDYARVSLQDVTIEGLTAPSQALVLKLKYRVARAFHRSTSGAMTGPVPSPWEEWWIDVDAVDDRRTLFELRAARLESAVKLKLPSGFKLTTHAAGAKSGADDEFLNWELGDNGAQRTLAARQAGGVFVPAEYEKFYEQSQLLLDRVKMPIAIEPPSASASSAE